MGRVLAISWSEVKASLDSFSFYLLLALFFGIAGYFFWASASYYSMASFRAAANPAQPMHTVLNAVEGISSPFMSNLAVLLLLLVPLLSMRSFAEERRQGTLELLFTYPLSESQIVFGKYLAMVFLVLVLILPTSLYFLIAGFVHAQFEATVLITSYFGLILVGASFSALGVFVSSATDNQVVSAGIGLSVLLFFWIIGWVADWANPQLAAIFRELSLVEHFRDFTRGVIDTRDIAFFGIFILFFLFATLSMLEIRSWKR